MEEKARYEKLFELCRYYNTPMGDGDNLDPKVVIAKKYLMLIPFEMLEKYYDKIISNYKFFPMKVELSEIYNSMLQYAQPDRIAPDHQLTEAGAMERYNAARETPVECPAKNEHLTYDDFKLDYKMLDADDLEKKYGRKKTYKWLYELAQNRTDDEWKEIDRAKMAEVRLKMGRDAAFYRNSIDDEKIKSATELFHK